MLLMNSMAGNFLGKGIDEIQLFETEGNRAFLSFNFMRVCALLPV